MDLNLSVQNYKLLFYFLKTEEKFRFRAKEGEILISIKL